MLPDAFRFCSIHFDSINSTILSPKSEVVVFSGFCLGRLRHSTSLEVTGIHYGDHLDPVIFDLWQLESAYWCFSASCLVTCHTCRMSTLRIQLYPNGQKLPWYGTLWGSTRTICLKCLPAWSVWPCSYLPTGMKSMVTRLLTSRFRLQCTKGPHVLLFHEWCVWIIWRRKV